MANSKKIKNKKAISHFDLINNKYKTFVKSKRSQIGSTLTWFIGFLVIFFVMMLFLGAVIILSATKGIKTGGKPIEYDSAALESQRVLINILNEKIIYNEQEITIKQLIEKWPASGDEKDKIKGKITEEFEKKLNALLKEDKGYIFYVAFSEKDIEIKDGIYGGGFIDISGAEHENTIILSSENFYTMHGAATEARAALEKAATLYFMLDKKVKIKLYIGKTKNVQK